MPDPKKDAIHILLNALRRVNPFAIIKERLKVNGDILSINGESISLADYDEVLMIGFGKASLLMGAAVESELGEKLTRGLLVTNRRHDIGVKSKIIVGGHPAPDRNSIEAGSKILELVASTDNRSLIIFLISGGGSSLVEFPIAPDISLDDFRQLNQILVRCGATIREINIIRRHFSAIKGGKLGYLARNSRLVALYLSDVNPGDIKSIASNPLMPDDVKPSNLQEVVKKYNLKESLPESMSKIVDQDKYPNLPGDWISEAKAATHTLLLENGDVLRAASIEAERLGYGVEIIDDPLEVNYKIGANRLIDRLISLRNGTRENSACLLSGGEVLCPVSGPGAGGRNQEFVLYCALRLHEMGFESNAVVLSCGTDGIDGNSTAAGALADSDTIIRSKRLGLDARDFLKRNDSNTFFQAAGGLIHTGPTGNNLRDIRVLVCGP